MRAEFREAGNPLPHDPSTFGMEAVGNKVYIVVGSDGSAYASNDEGTLCILLIHRVPCKMIQSIKLQNTKTSLYSNL